MSFGVDCFPSLVIDDPDKWQRYDLTFQDLRDKFLSQSQAFVSRIPENFNPYCKLYYHSQSKSNVIIQNERWCLKSSDVAHELKPLSWDRMFNKLTKPVKTEIKTCDQRMCFRYCSIFLTKCYFTFGYRSVPENHYHLYQTGKNPILFFKQRHSVSKHYPIEQRSINVNHYTKFEKFVLEPETLYYSSPETNYILFTCQKSLFAVDVVKKSTWKKLKHRYSFSKVTEREWCPQKRKRVTFKNLGLDFAPPATPAMDTIHDFYPPPLPDKTEAKPILDKTEAKPIPKDYTPDATAFFPHSRKKKVKKSCILARTIHLVSRIHA
ncbi:unnamed protein product [Larinioides sclopetarius]|uniref:Uncharacterized protein n=1 Tax=Larinioides sclopetarius TaxID=280406 RepID=A0AAV2BR95_9ARAC